MRVVFVVVLEPTADLFQSLLCVWQGADLNIVALDGFHEGRAIGTPLVRVTMASETPLLSGLATGVKQAFRPIWAAKTLVFFAV